MTKCNHQTELFTPLKGRRIDLSFEGGEITSDAGFVLLRQADRKLDLSPRLNQLIPDPRNPHFTAHSQLSMLQQEVYSLALGYEDLNDHDHLNRDTALQTAVGRQETLASSPTLCRFINRANAKTNWSLSKHLVEVYIRSLKTPPEEVILDFDATDSLLHGEQEGKFFHGYYDNYCYLPLYVFAGNYPLFALLRRSNIDASKGTLAVLRYLVRKLREAWPTVRIILRADSGFCRWRTLRWCERHGVGYIVGVAKNQRTLAMSGALEEQVKQRYAELGCKQKLFGELSYAAESWDRERRVIVKAEYNSLGANTRFVVTTLEGEGRELYEQVYCARGDMENRIKEQQLELFSDRMSHHAFQANWFRMLLSTYAYILVDTVRRVGLAATGYAKLSCRSVRLMLLKIGAVVIRNTRRIRLLCSSSHPWQKLFWLAARNLRPAPS